MEIIQYQSKYRQQVIDLILHIQNDEAKIDLQIEEQPDLLDVEEYYFKNGGNFLFAVEDNKVIGTFAYMNYENVIAQELHAHGFPLYYYNSKKMGELDLFLRMTMSCKRVPLFTCRFT